MNAANIALFLKTKRGKALLFVVFLLLFVTQVVPQLIAREPYVKAFIAHVQKATTAEVSIRGGSAFKVLPRPVLQLYDVNIGDIKNPKAPAVSLPMVEIALDVGSLLSDAPKISEITLKSVKVNFEKNTDQSVAWGFLGAGIFRNMASDDQSAPMDLRVIDGEITFNSGLEAGTEKITAINALGRWGDLSTLSGSFISGEKTIAFDVTRNGRKGETPFTISLNEGADNRLELEGKIDFTAEQPAATGTLKINTRNILAYVMPKEKADTSALATVNNQSVAVSEQVVEMPLAVKSDYRQKEGLIALSNMTVESGKSKATGAFSWSDGEKKEQKIALQFSTLDFDALMPLLRGGKESSNDVEAIKSFLSDRSRNLKMDITADEVMRASQQWKTATFNGVVADGQLTVNQFSITLPGDSKLALFGLISHTDVQGMRFEGNCEASGTSLRNALTVFDASALGLPETGFGKFEIRSNIFISSEQLRLSEADMKFSEIALKGGMVAYFDAKKPRVEANIRLRDINFDYVRDSWREQAKNNAKEEYFLAFNNQLDYAWLRKLASSIDFKVEVIDFTFLERKGKDASFRLFAQAGEFGVYNAKFNYGTDITEANLVLDVKGDKPKLNLALNTNALNTDYFSAKPSLIAPVAIEDPATVPLEENGESLPELPAPTAPEHSTDGDDSYEAGGSTAIAPSDPVATETVITSTPQSFIINEANAQQAQAILPVSNQGGWSEELLDMSWMEAIDGTFDISIGKLVHKNKLFQNFKMFAKLERNLLTFQTLTFAHWNGSFSINGTLFGGKVPGMSMGFVLASADMKQLLGNMLGVHEMGGKVSVSGTVETSGVNLLSWVSQANAQLLFAGRGVTVQGFDLASVLTAVQASRTAADAFNNVNLSLVQGTGDYSVDGTLNVQNGVMSTAGIAMKTGRILGNVKGNLKLIPWTLSMSGLFQFPELESDTVPTMTVKWDGPLEKPMMQVDTQSLEAFVSKRITGD